MKKWFVVLICSAWILPVYAEKAYKWIDEEGSVQITQTPPPSGAKEVKQIDLPKALMPNTLMVSPPKQTPPPKKEEKKDSPKTPDVDVAKMTPQQIHEYNCTNAKRQLDMLKENEKVVIPDKKDGKTLHLASEEQRNAEIKKAEESVDKFCNAPPPIVQPQNPNDKKPEENTEKK